MTVKDDRGLVFVFNNNEQLLKLHRREVLGNFVKVSEDEISACKVEIMNDKGRSGREGSDNFESEPWSNTEFLAKFELSHINRKPEIRQKLESAFEV